MNEVKALSLDVRSLADTIRDKVRSTIASIIPDDQIDGLVKKEYESFFVAPVKQNSWDTSDKRSEFQVMVRAEIEKKIREKVSEAANTELNRFFAQNVWDATGKKVVEQLVKEYAPAALEGMASAIVHSTMQKLQQNRPY